MTTAERHTWSELYLMQDLYSAWIRVLLRWLYLEGMSCCPTATVEFESEAKAAEAAADWTRLSEGSWAVQSVERSAVAIHNEAFEAEEAQEYTSALEAFNNGVGRPGRLCSVCFLDPGEFSDSIRSKMRKMVGGGNGEDEDEDEDHVPLVLALLRRWKELPGSFPGSKFELSGTVVKGGLSGLRVISFDGTRELEVTEVLERALRDTLEFMKEHKIAEKTPWFSNEEIGWKAPNAGAAKTIAELIQTCQGSAKAKGDVVKGPAREIWSVVSWLKFGRWGGVFKDYSPARSDPRIPELSGPAPSEGSFAGEVVCFTGKLDAMERDEAEGLVESLGGRSASRVTREVTLVVAAREASSKRSKAEKLGIPIIDEAGFLKRAGR